MPRFVTSSAVVPAVIFLVVAQWSADARAADPVIKWRTDYNTARKESQDTGLPLLIQIGTEECFYCKKMDASTFRDSGVLTMMSGFIPLKIDGNKDTALVKALKIQLYPTTVLAGPDASIHAFVQGYVAVDAFKEQLKRTTDLVGVDTKAVRELAEATAAVKAGEYAKALPLLQRLSIVAKGKPAEAKVREALSEIEKVAAGKLVAAGKSSDVVAALNDFVKAFPGTAAAGRAESQLVALGVGKLDRVAIAIRATSLMTAARDLARAGAYSEALNICELLDTTSESKSAQTLANEIRSNPTHLTTLSRQANEKAAALQLAMADAHLAKGESAEATKCYEMALLLAPQSANTATATAQLTKLRGGVPALPVSRPK